MNTQTSPTSLLRQDARAAHTGGATGLRSAATASKRLKEAQSTLQALEARELLALPAQVVSGLPAPVSMRLRVPGAPVPVVLWTGRIRSQTRQSTPVLADVIVLDGEELDAIVCACQADRLWHSDFLGLCFEKWRRPEVPVRAAELLDGANADESAQWTLGRVLSRLGLEIESLELDEEEPVARPLYAAA